MTYHFPKKILVSRISLTRGHFIRLMKILRWRGATTAEKLRRPRLGSQHRGARDHLPHPSPSPVKSKWPFFDNHPQKIDWGEGAQRPGWFLGAGGGRPLPLWGSGGITRKIFENSDAKSCILVTAYCEISCFLKTTAKKLGDRSPPVLTVVAPV